MSDDKTPKSLLGTPEQQKAVAEWRAKLADSMTASLNAAVTAKNWIVEDTIDDVGGQIFVGCEDMIDAMRQSAGKDWTKPLAEG